MDHVRVDVLQYSMKHINFATVARAEREMVKSNARLREAIFRLRRTRYHEHRFSSEPSSPKRTSSIRAHAEEVADSIVKAHALVEFAYDQTDVTEAREFHD